MGYYITLDVGGTNIKAGIIDSKGCILNGKIKTYDAMANQSKEVIFSNLIDIIKEQANCVDSDDFIIKGVGLAFPGPFDYERGISHIVGINKYEALQGVNVKSELTNYIYKDKFFKNRLCKDFSILFENDANLFALGEYYSGKGKNHYKSIYICIGTGVGSAFIENGQLVKFREDVPKNGWVYDTPFKESIIDNYISARGIINIAKDIISPNLNISVKELSTAATLGDYPSKKVFDVFGTFMGEALLSYIVSFKPDAVILGGQISKSTNLFIDAFNFAIKPFEPIIKISDNSSISTLVGVYNLFKLKSS